MSEKAELRGIWLVTVAALLWSSGGLGIKAVEDSAMKVSFYRSAVAAVVLFILFRPKKFSWTVPFLTAVISYAGCVTAFVIANKMTTAANAIFLQYSGVVWVMIGSALVLREPLKRRDVVAIVVALGGMALFFVGRFESGTIAGNLVALLSGLFFAMLTLALRHQRGTAAESAVTWGNVLAALMILPFVYADLALTPKSTVVLGFLGVFQMAIAYAFFVRGLEHVTATAAFLTGMLEPVANPVWVFLVLGERPSFYAILGGAVVLGAIAWRTLSLGPPHRRKIAPPD